MQTRIIIGCTNFDRVRLGETIFLVPILKDVKNKLRISIDFNKVYELLSNYRYVNTFLSLGVLAEDIIKRTSGASIGVDLYELESNPRYVFHRRAIDSTFSKKSINILMLNFLNTNVWPGILRLILQNMSQGETKERWFKVGISYCDIFNIYEMFGEQNVKEFDRKTSDSILDIITWFTQYSIYDITVNEIVTSSDCLEIYFKACI